MNSLKFLVRATLTAAALVIALPAAQAQDGAQDHTIIVASTTSTQNSGLFRYLLPKFTQKTGITVKVVALGTGRALDLARRGDADVVFVHDKAAELKFLEQGYATKRYDVMYNDFVLLGPKADPAHIKGKSVTDAMKTLAAAKAPFISRGDRSGTNAAELRLWKAAGVDIKAVKGEWYREVGQGMGATLNIASASNAYTLSDRGTWISFKNKGDLAILVQGDKNLFNQYGVMLVNPAKYPHVKAKDGEAFIQWLLSDEGQKTIASYKVHDQELFFPNARGSKGS